MKAIIVEGIIGAGKTTLLDTIANSLRERGLKVCVIKEPVQQWIDTGILQEFYDDMKSNAYKFQTFTFITRMNDAIECVEKHQGQDIDLYILERSIFSDRFFFAKNLYDNKIITQVEYDMYISWWHLWNRVFPFQKFAFVYLRPSIDECMRRLEERNRDGESGKVPIDYQLQLLKLHDEFFGITEDPMILDGTKYQQGTVNINDSIINMLTVKTNGDFREDPLREKIVDNIMNFYNIL